MSSSCLGLELMAHCSQVVVDAILLRAEVPVLSLRESSVRDHILRWGLLPSCVWKLSEKTCGTDRMMATLIPKAYLYTSWPACTRGERHGGAR